MNMENKNIRLLKTPSAPYGIHRCEYRNDNKLVNEFAKAAFGIFVVIAALILVKPHLPAILSLLGAN